MTPSKPNVNAKTVQEALDSIEARMFQRGYPITGIMRVTGKSYTYVKNVLDLAGLTGVSGAAKRSA